MEHIGTNKLKIF